MQKYKTALVVGGIVIAGLAVLTASFTFIAPRLEGSGKPTTVQCPQKGKARTAVIKDNTISPAHTQAKPCDTLTIKNEGTITRIMAFGVHEQHVSYDGKKETRLTEGQELTITLNQKGTFLFHDHLYEDVSANFTVAD